MQKNSMKTARTIGRPFQKGQSGNPKGRPLGQKNYSTLYRQAFVKLAQANNVDPHDLEVEIICNAIVRARKGHYVFYKDVMDRIYGKAPAQILNNIPQKGSIASLIKTYSSGS